jgi:sugar transferase (PEP-CTERM system associated)
LVRLFNVYYPKRTLILLFGEIVIIGASFLAAGLLRFGRDFSLKLNYENGFARIGLVSGICLLCLYYFDLYDTGIITNAFEVLTRLVQVLGATCVITAFLYYVYPPVQLELSFLMLALLFMGICLAASRNLFFALNKSTFMSERAIILGGGLLADSIAAEVRKRPELGLRLLGRVGQPENPGSNEHGLPCLGDVENLSALVERAHVSQVIVAMTERRGKLPVESLIQLKAKGVQVQNGEEVYENLAGKVPVDSFRLSWLLYSPGPTVSKPILFYKRVASVLFSFLGLLLSSPLMVLTALAIKLDSRGPVFYRQKRVGKDGKTFTLYKFRSMRDDPEANDEYKPAQKNDARVTRVGRWLRRAHLDELPQLYNIFRGDIYFVGPRPFVPNQEKELVDQIPFYRQRWIVRPGATGWAQINQGYCATLEDNTEKLAYDLFYIKNMSIGLDLLIAFRTVKVMLLGRGGR